MNELELKSIWSAYDKKLERSLKLNLKIFEDMQTGKAKSKLDALLSIKVGGVAIGVLWMAFLGFLVYVVNFKNLWFSGSVVMIMIFTLVAMINYIQHIILINKIDYTKNITGTQTKLAELQVSTIHTTAFAWLQLPFYTTFFWNNNWIMEGDKGFWFIAVPITVIFIIITIWLYKSITPENLHKTWVRKLMMVGMEYKYALSASELLQEITEFKKDEV
ncbi:MAG: hypothetical protein JWP37_2466 [Mucilaginibacter sp.]|nr:hypothetical protein [Mucilaginibacter sp.]